nr:hypothetical protein [Acidiferrobacterales bacterium]
LTNEISPVEADVGRFVNDHKENFIGKSALDKIRQGQPELKIVYLDVELGDNDIAGNETVFVDGKPIGITTSGGFGHTTGKSLGFAYVDAEFAAEGTKLAVELLGQMREAVVINDPVWDPKAERSRA